MLFYQIRLFFRGLRRLPGYTLLNLCCLSFGLAAALVILMYLNFEGSYDRFHSQADRIFRIETPIIKTHDKEIPVGWSSTPVNLATYVQEDYPEVADCIRFYQFFNSPPTFTYQGQSIEEWEVEVVDPRVFEVFSFDLLQGNKSQALSSPNQIVLSESLAKRIFGSEDPMGKVLPTQLVHNHPDTDENYSLIVKGIYLDLPQNAHLRPEAMISASTDPHAQSYHFKRFNSSTYVLLTPEAAPEALTAKLSAIYERHLDPAIEPVLAGAEHSMVPMIAIHMNETGAYTYLYIFGAIGLLILLISGISYVNLVTAQGSRRALSWSFLSLLWLSPFLVCLA